MGLSNYNDLVVSISDWLNRDDLTGLVDDFIDIAEARINREVRTKEMIARAINSVEAGNRRITLPAGFLEMKRLQLNTNSIDVLFQVSSELLSHRFFQQSSGKPRYFSIHEEIEFDRDTDAEYDVEMVYYKQVTALSDGNQTNELFPRHADLYLFASLAAAAEYVDDDTDTEKFERLYAKVRDDVNKLHELGQGGPVFESPDIPTP